MNDLKVKLLELEGKVNKLKENQNIGKKHLKELLTEVSILESLTEIAEGDADFDRILKLKGEIQSRSNAQAYGSVDRNIRIGNVNKGAEKISKINEFIKEYVNDQANMVDIVEINAAETLNSAQGANEQMRITHDYLKRKNSFIRKIFLLVFVFAVLLGIKILY